MKLHPILLSIIILLLNTNILICQNSDSYDSEKLKSTYTIDSINWDIKALNTARDSSYLSEMEKNVILEINMLRNNPARYAQLYIQPRLIGFNDKYFNNGTSITLITKEGKQAVLECINALNSQKEMPSMYPNYKLCKMAEYMTNMQGNSTETGHNSPNGKIFADRLKMFKIEFQNSGENISYGYNNAREIIIQLIIDDGVSNRGHRLNLFKSFNQVGVSIGTHKKFNYMCVQDFSL